MPPDVKGSNKAPPPLSVTGQPLDGALAVLHALHFCFHSWFSMWKEFLNVDWLTAAFVRLEPVEVALFSRRDVKFQLLSDKPTLVPSVFVSVCLSVCPSVWLAISYLCFSVSVCPLPLAPTIHRKMHMTVTIPVMDVMLHELFTLIVHVSFSTAPVSDQLIKPHTQHYQCAADLVRLVVHVPFSTAPVSNQLIRPHTQHYQYAADLVRLVVHVPFSWVRLFRLQPDFRIQISFRNQ